MIDLKDRKELDFGVLQNKPGDGCKNLDQDKKNQSFYKIKKDLIQINILK